jgi:low temperature requirement protein LtrA
MSGLPRFLPRPKVSGAGHRVTTFELFFDLVFVFAFTQLTEYMATAHNALGVLQAMIILVILWISWCSYTWLANQTHVDEGVVQLGMGVAMVAMFVVALVIPETFEDMAGGLSGPVVFVIAYLVVRFAHISLYLFAAADDAGLRRQILRTNSVLLVSGSLLLTGALVGGIWQTALWATAIVVDGFGIWWTSRGGEWRLYSPGHWSERHGLVVILALGESVVAIGVGAAHEPISVPILTGGILAILMTIALWFLYFDSIAIASEHELAGRPAAERVELARDAYTYLHFPLIAGIVIAALGVEEVIAHATEVEPLGLFGAAALLGGPSLYLAGHAFFWYRLSGHWKHWRLAGGVVLLALIPVGAALPPLAGLAVAVAVLAAVVGAELTRHGDVRAEVRARRQEE